MIVVYIFFHVVSSFTGKFVKKRHQNVALNRLLWDQKIQLWQLFLGFMFLFCMFLCLVCFGWGTYCWQGSSECEGDAIHATSISMNSLQTVFCQLHNRMFCLIFSSRMWLPCITRSLCWKLFLDLYIDIFQCPLHVLLYDWFFYSGQREKESCLEWSHQGTLFCMYCMCCMFFWCFLFYSRNWKSWAKKSTSSRRFAFFLNVCDHETKIFCWELCAARRRKIFLHWMQSMSRCAFGHAFCVKKNTFSHVFIAIQGAWRYLQVEGCFLSIGIEFHISLAFIFFLYI